MHRSLKCFSHDPVEEPIPTYRLDEFTKKMHSFNRCSLSSYHILGALLGTAEKMLMLMVVVMAT